MKKPCDGVQLSSSALSQRGLYDEEAPPSDRAKKEPPMSEHDLKLIRLNSHGIDAPDAPPAATYPYKLTAILSPPKIHGGDLHMSIRWV